eukprot:6195300-Pleurochrysis_carterae.AAC.1
MDFKTDGTSGLKQLTAWTGDRDGQNNPWSTTQYQYCNTKCMINIALRASILGTSKRKITALRSQLAQI